VGVWHRKSVSFVVPPFLMHRAFPSVADAATDFIKKKVFFFCPSLLFIYLCIRYIH